MQVGFHRAHAHRRKEALREEPSLRQAVASGRAAPWQSGDGHRGGACRKGAVVAAHIKRETETERARRRRVEMQKAQEGGAEAVVYICLSGF